MGYAGYCGLTPCKWCRHSKSSVRVEIGLSGYRKITIMRSVSQTCVNRSAVGSGFYRNDSWRNRRDKNGYQEPKGPCLVWSTLHQKDCSVSSHGAQLAYSRPKDVALTGLLRVSVWSMPCTCIVQSNCRTPKLVLEDLQYGYVFVRHSLFSCLSLCFYLDRTAQFKLNCKPCLKPEFWCFIILDHA